METYNDDYLHIAPHLGENTTVEIPVENVSTGRDIRNVTAQYFSNVTKEVKDQLNNIYYSDLALFGYRPY